MRDRVRVSVALTSVKTPQKGAYMMGLPVFVLVLGFILWQEVSERYRVWVRDRLEQMQL